MPAGGLTQDESWAYVARASINAQRVRLADADRWQLAWQAICYCECAIVLWPDDPHRHRELASWFDTLELAANFSRCLERALELHPDDHELLNERLRERTNVGDYAAAQELLSRHQEVLNDAESDAIRAYIAMRNGSPAEGLARIDAAATKDVEPTDRPWRKKLRADCLWLLDRREEAIAVLEEVASWYRGDANDRSTCAHAALLVGLWKGNLEPSLPRLEREGEVALPTQTDAEIWCALADLGMGRVEAGQTLLLRAIWRETNPRWLADLRDLELPRAVQIYQGKPHGEAFAEVVALATRAIEGRLAALAAEPATPERELVAVREEAPGALPQAPWTGASVALARLRHEGGRPSEAATLYREVQQRAAESFPEASVALQAALRDWCAQADTELESNGARALDQYEQALRLVRTALPHDQAQQAELCARIGHARVRLHRAREARADFSCALAAYREQKAEPGTLGTVCRGLLRSVDDYWQLDAAWLEWLAEANAEDRDDIGDARRRLEGFLSDKLGLVGGSQERPSYRPIILEIGERLVADDTGPDWVLFERYIPALKQRILESTGVSIWGVRVRGSGYLTGDYTILLDELVVAAGTTQPDRQFVRQSELAQPEQLVDARYHALDPESGEPGWWLDDAELTAQDAHAHARPALRFCVDHLEFALRQRVSRFVGLDSASCLLSSIEGADPVVQQLLDKHDRHRRGLIRALRGLADERVSLAPWPELLHAYVSLAESGVSPDELPGRLRGKLATRLPGNAPGWRQQWLSSEWIERLCASDERADLLQSDPQEALALLAGLRRRVSDRRTAIVVPGARRDQVSRLVRALLPWLPVIAAEELLPTTGAARGADA